MNMVIDVGNTLTKVGIFEKDSLLRKEVFATPAAVVVFLADTPAENLIVSSVTHDPSIFLSSSRIAKKKIVLSTAIHLPLAIGYATPATLGLDRIAAACGAWALFPGNPILVIDAGTCINYEFVSKTGEYKGGAISPGVEMRFEAMHRLTAKLPRAQAVDESPLIGDSTLGCLQSGVMNGTLEEIKGIIKRYQTDSPGARVILCGGDAHFFEKHLKPSIFVAPDLVLTGLNSILLHNVIS